MEAVKAEPGEVFGRYRLVSRIGRGGMGEIHLAVGPGLAGVEKRVAIKRLPRDLAEEPGFVTRFLDEARLVMQLSHGNIVPVFDAGHLAGEYFLAMEYVDGGNLGELSDRLRLRSRRLPVPLALYLIAEVARGLDYAHRKLDASGRPLNIIHRDVSPQNILLGLDGQVRLGDFGIAQAVGRSHRTRTGALVGKFAYMSPEQALGYRLDARSDVFSLGVVLFELLSGQPLFEGESDPEVLRKVQEARIPPLPPELEEATPGLDLLIRRALARNPGDRFASMSELGWELGTLLHRGPPVGAPQLGALLCQLSASATPPPARPLALALAPPPLASLPGSPRVTQTFVPEGEGAPAPARAADPVDLESLAFPHRRLRMVAGLGALLTAVAGAGLLARSHRSSGGVVAEPTPVVALVPPLLSAETAPPPVTVPRPARHLGARDEGYLNLRVSPASRISVDGQALGMTAALVRHPLTAGSHEVVVRNELTGREETLDLTLAAGETVTRRLDLSASGAVAR